VSEKLQATDKLRATSGKSLATTGRIPALGLDRLAARVRGKNLRTGDAYRTIKR